MIQHCLELYSYLELERFVVSKYDSFLSKEVNNLRPEESELGKSDHMQLLKRHNVIICYKNEYQYRTLHNDVRYNYGTKKWVSNVPHAHK